MPQTPLVGQHHLSWLCLTLLQQINLRDLEMGTVMGKQTNCWGGEEGTSYGSIIQDDCVYMYIVVAPCYRNRSKVLVVWGSSGPSVNL